MMARLFRRQQESQLTKDLNGITESGVIDVPKPLLDSIVEASKNEEDRKEIMVHLRECLKEPAGKKWRRVHAALVVAEDLFGQGRGAPELVAEVASGRHFDLAQRLAFLEVYQHSETHAQGMVRAKAKALRAELVQRIQQVAFVEDSASTCSTAVPKSHDGSVASADTRLSHGTPLGPKQTDGARVLYSLGGFVAVGHNDDTTDESSGDEHRRTYRDRRKNAQRQRASEQSQLKSLPMPSVSQQVDLLEF